jgi:hypothetical protein
MKSKTTVARLCLTCDSHIFSVLYCPIISRQQHASRNNISGSLTSRDGYISEAAAASYYSSGAMTFRGGAPTIHMARPLPVPLPIPVAMSMPLTARPFVQESPAIDYRRSSSMNWPADAVPLGGYGYPASLAYAQQQPQYDPYGRLIVTQPPLLSPQSQYDHYGRPIAPLSSSLPGPVWANSPQHASNQYNHANGSYPSYPSQAWGAQTTQGIHHAHSARGSGPPQEDWGAHDSYSNLTQSSSSSYDNRGGEQQWGGAHPAGSSSHGGQGYNGAFFNSEEYGEHGVANSQSHRWNSQDYDAHSSRFGSPTTRHSQSGSYTSRTPGRGSHGRASQNSYDGSEATHPSNGYGGESYDYHEQESSYAVYDDDSHRDGYDIGGYDDTATGENAEALLSSNGYEEFENNGYHIWQLHYTEDSEPYYLNISKTNTSMWEDPRKYASEADAKIAYENEWYDDAGVFNFYLTSDFVMDDDAYGESGGGGEIEAEEYNSSKQAESTKQFWKGLSVSVNDTEGKNPSTPGGNAPPVGTPGSNSSQKRKPPPTTPSAAAGGSRESTPTSRDLSPPSAKREEYDDNRDTELQVKAQPKPRAESELYANVDSKQLKQVGVDERKKAAPSLDTFSKHSSDPSSQQSEPKLPKSSSALALEVKAVLLPPAAAKSDGEGHDGNDAFAAAPVLSGGAVKYERMLSLGVPLPSVLNKMKMDGVDQQTIHSLATKFSTRVSVPSRDNPQPMVIERPAPPASNGGMSEEERRRHLTKKYNEELKDDEEVRKYFKMKSFGVPPRSVIQKMLKDGISEEKAEKWGICCGIFPNSGGGMTLPMSPYPGGRGGNSLERQPSTSMQKLHWNTLSADQVEKSVWATPRGPAAIADEEFRELETLFAAKPSAGVMTPRIKEVPQRLELIDPKRAQNVDIGLAQFKNYSFEEVGRKIVTLTLEFPSDKLLNLQLLMPDDQEIHKVKQFSGDISTLRNAEKFFIAMSKIDRVNAKLEVIIFKTSFRDQIVETKERIAVISSACWQVMNSTKFTAMLDKCLQVGNFMNAGSYKGSAQGFTLDSLLKLTTTRSGVDKKTSVLDYIVRTTVKKNEVCCLFTFLSSFFFWM